MDDVIDRRVHIVSPLTVLISLTFFVGDSGNFVRSHPLSSFEIEFHWKLSVHYIENILTLTYMKYSWSQSLDK